MNNKPEDKTDSLMARLMCASACDLIGKAADTVRLSLLKAPPSTAKEELAILYRRFGEVQMKLNELKRKL